MVLERITKTFAKRFSRRAALLLFVKLGLIGGVAFRLYRLQVVEAPEYRKLADENQINTRVIAPVRGEIFDRYGAALAVNQLNYRVIVVREQMKNPEETLGLLRRIISISEKNWQRIIREMRQRSSFLPVLVREYLTWEEFSLLNLNAPALPGVTPEVGWSRAYPYDELLAHTIGYVSAVTERDRQRNRQGENDPLLRLPDFQIGKSGIELAVERQLRGSAGRSRVEVNALGRVIRELDRDVGRPGAKIGLTLDLSLQQYAMQRVGEESAGVVVIDIHNGDIIAMISAPSYNPNSFVRGISHREWNALLEDDHRPLVNKATAGVYPPGSTFKMIVALAALEHGIISPRETIFCNSRFQLGTQTFHCWKRQGHGQMNLKDALKESCDIYFYEIALKLGIERITEMSKRFGLGEHLPVELPNIQGGLMPTKAWKRRVKNDVWHPGDTVNAGIGQGYLLSTPLQLAVMTARIANGKLAVKPRLVRSVDEKEIPVIPGRSLDINPDHMKIIRDGMFAVCNEKGGTALRSRIADPENLMSGKTGTAQVRRITKAERAVGVRKNKDLPWRFRDHALFVSYAPAHAPKYALGIIVEHGGGGATTAAPIARDIMMHALYKGEPPLEAYPPEVRQEIILQREAEIEVL